MNKKTAETALELAKEINKAIINAVHNTTKDDEIDVSMAVDYAVTQSLINHLSAMHDLNGEYNITKKLESIKNLFEEIISMRRKKEKD